MKKVILIYSTFGTKENAIALAMNLIDKKSIACYNLHSIKSGYHWEGKFCQDDEWVLICKTLPEFEKKVRQQIEELHSYDTPCILSWAVNANEKYYRWISDCVKLDSDA